MDRVKYLILQWLREEITPTEQVELEVWATADHSHAALLAELQNVTQVAEGLSKLEKLHPEQAWGQIQSSTKKIMPAVEMTKVQVAEDGTIILPRRRNKWWMAAATVILLLGTGGAYWLLTQKQSPTPSALATTSGDIPAPARSRATLTLANGQTVYLDSAANGQLASQGAATIQKRTNGQISYIPVTSGGTPSPLNHNAVLYNTLANPRGSRVINLTLSDGTKIWLNAASSVRYPVIFPGDSRSVEVTGEAYLEVTKDAHKPFTLTAGGETVDVLGTAFNINAYPDEQGTRTTLLEGAVRVTPVVGVNPGGGKPSLILEPGQQAQLSLGEPTNTNNGAPKSDPAPTGLKLVKGVNVEEVMAWKNGLFSFQDADVQTVMRQLARWYNVEVTYEGDIPQREFNGEIGKALTLDQVLKVLSKARIHYTIDGNKLTIRP